MKIKPLHLKVFQTTLLLKLLLIVTVCGVTGAQDFTYLTNGGTITITRYIGTNEVVAIPSTIDGFSVTTIGTNAFAGKQNVINVIVPNGVKTLAFRSFAFCEKLASITIPDSVTSIGDLAFVNCSKLKGVVLSNGLEVIGNSTFQRCENLTDIAVPSTVTGIGIGVFAGCTKLTNVTIGSALANIPVDSFIDCASLMTISVDPFNTGYTDIDGVLFTRDKTTLVRCPPGKLACTIPDTVTNLESYAFEFCTGLTDIRIPNGALRVGDESFYLCTALTNISIPDTVTTIGRFAFEFCTRLSTVALPDSLKSIGERAFANCSSLKRLTIPPLVTSLADAVFKQCIGLTNVALSNTLTNIGQYSFFGCSNLTSINIPDSVQTIGGFAFQQTGLTNISFGSNLTYLDGYALAYCANLREIYFEGDAPFPDSEGRGVLVNVTNATVYVLPGTTGWKSTFGGLPTRFWLPSIEPSGNGFVLSNSFGFGISWAKGTSVAVEACTNLNQPTWTSLQTNTLADGYSLFNESVSDEFETRFYRLRPLWSPHHPIPTNFFTLYSFAGPKNGNNFNFPLINDDGAWSKHSLVLSGPMLYGMAEMGGTWGFGTVFRMRVDRGGFDTLHSFDGSDGSSPVSAVILSRNSLYGTTSVGGSVGALLAGHGTIFRINTDGRSFTNLHVFANDAQGRFSAGEFPSGALALSGDTLYGTTEGSGDGTVFKINIGGTDFSTLYAFAPGVTDPSGVYTNADGSRPSGLLLRGNTLFGTTLRGGAFGFGTIFALNIEGWRFTNLHVFSGRAEGGTPRSTLAIAASGDALYGTTVAGGDWNGGTVFRLNTDGTGFEILHSFNSAIDGSEPNGVALSGSTLYGTARGGGEFAQGIIFSVTVNGTAFKTLYSFRRGGFYYPNFDGALPSSGLIIDNNILYGTTTFGGVGGNGTIFGFALPP